MLKRRKTFASSDIVSQIEKATNSDSVNKQKEENKKETVRFDKVVSTGSTLLDLCISLSVPSS